MINIKNLILNKNTIRVFLGSVAISQGISAYNNSKIDLPEKISTSITFSLTNYDEFIEPNIYFLDDLSKINDDVSISDLRKVNLTYTKKNFNKVKELDIDVARSDINDLYKFPNLKKLTLYNYDLLTDDDKNIINRLNSLKEIDFDSNYRMLNNNHDFSWVNSSVNVKITNSTNSINDLEDLFLYRLFNELKKEYPSIEIDYFNEERLNELKDWNRKIENIVKTFAFDETTSVEDKILTLTEYVTTTYSYDKDVSQAIKDGINPNENEKTLYYNRNLLKSLLTDGNFDGICCNYAALLSLLGRYTNVDLKYITGTCGEGKNNGHAWCEYGDIIIDPTMLDANTQYNTLKGYLNRYEDYMSPVAIDSYKNALLEIIEILNTDTSYNNYNKYPKNTIKKDVEYENIYSDEYKKKVNDTIRKENEIVLIALLGISLTMIPKEKNKEKEKQKEMNNIPKYI